MRPVIEFKDVSVNTGRKPLIQSAGFCVYPNDFFMIAGPNGAGKTTLIRALCGETPYTGLITYNGCDVRSLRAKEFAKNIGVLSQKNSAGYAFVAREVIETGRYAYSRGIIPRLSDADREAVDAAMQYTNTAAFADRSVLTLSGGEYQRVMLAKIIAQDPAVLVLDEPLNHLDFPHQLEFFELLKAWVADRNKTVIAVVHDFNLVKAYGTRALLLLNAQVYASGGIREVFTEQNLKSVYNIDVAEWMRLQLKNWQAP